MKRICLTISLFIGIITAFPVVVPAETVVVVASNFPPYAFINQSDKSTRGIYHDIVVASFKAMGVDVDFRIQPVKRAFFSFAKHKATFYTSTEGLIKRGGIPAEKLSVIYEGYLKSTFSYFKSHHKGKAVVWENPADLKPYKIGNILGSPMTPLLKKAGLTVDSTASLESSAKKLRYGRIDLMEGLDIANRFLVKTLYPDKIDDYAETRKPLAINRGVFVFWKNDKNAHELAKKYITGSKKIKQNGVYMEIQKKYWGESVPKSILESFGYFQELRVDSL